MLKSQQLKKEIIDLFNSKSQRLNSIALDIFEFQYKNNAIFLEYLDLLPAKYLKPQNISEIPHIPISFFKQHEIKSGCWKEEIVFKSSGTTNTINHSHHYIKDTEWYKAISKHCFELIYGNISEYCYLALLPHYLEKGESSLVYMVNSFINSSKYSQSQFYLHNHNELAVQLKKNKIAKIPTVLFGVSYALLDFFENHHIDYEDLIVIDTGGMKGRRKEMIKEELYALFTASCNAKNYTSEYGMTELLSQSYAADGLNFILPPTMYLSVREVNDPFTEVKYGKPGIANIIDLANIDTCSFIATEDLVVKNIDGTFQVLGRIDNSDMRGCNLLVAN